MMIAPEALVAHRIRGRVRFIVPAMQKDRSYFERTEKELRTIPEVVKVLVNPLTGSIIIYFHGKWAPFRARLDTSALFRVSSRKRRLKGDSVPKALLELRKLDSKVMRATDCELSLRSLVGLGLIGLSALQLARMKFLPPASTLLSEGFRMLMETESL